MLSCFKHYIWKSYSVYVQSSSAELDRCWSAPTAASLTSAAWLRDTMRREQYKGVCSRITWWLNCLCDISWKDHQTAAHEKWTRWQYFVLNCLFNYSLIEGARTPFQIVQTYFNPWITAALLELIWYRALDQGVIAFNAIYTILHPYIFFLQKQKYCVSSVWLIFCTATKFLKFL